MKKKLRLNVRKMPDGRYSVEYYWSYFARWYFEIFSDLKSLQTFLSEIIEKTEW